MGALFLSPAREPVYQGRTLSEWRSEQLRNPPGPEASNALRQIGTNLLPRIARKFAARDSSLKERYLSMVDRAIFKIPTAGDAHAEGFALIESLGPGAVAAIPLLQKSLLTEEEPMDAARYLARMGAAGMESLRLGLSSTNERVRSCSALALSGSAGLESETVPLLIQRLGDTDASVRANAAASLGELAGLPEVAVPGLVSVLKDRDTTVRRYAARALGKFGRAGRAAVAELSERTRDLDSVVRDNAVNSIRQIEGGR